MGGVGGGVVCGWDERMDATYLSVFHTVSNRAHGKRSSLQLVFFSRARDSPFTLHDLTDFYVERVTAHPHNLWPNSKTKLKLKHLWEQGGPLVFRGPYAACVFCV